MENISSEISRYIGIWSPTLFVGLIIAAVGIIILISGFSRKDNTVRNNVFSIIMLFCGLFLCVGFIPDNIVSDFVEFRKPLRMVTTLICNPVCSAFGVCMLLYAALYIFMKSRSTIYRDTIIPIVSVILGTITELCAFVITAYGIYGFINYMNI